MPGDATRRRSLSARLRRARREGFVGRDDEVRRFRRALDGDVDVAPVLLLHGPGGIGKTSLLERLAQEADDVGRTVVRLDAAALDRATFACDTAAPVLLVDALEEAPGTEAWLRHEVLPHLPDDAVVVIAGRDRPAPEWQTDPGWRELVDQRRLPPLVDDDAARLLRDRGAPRRALPALVRFAGGNPLALCLAADDAGRDGAWAPGRHVVRTLLDRIVDAPPDAAHDVALRVCAHARHTTVDLLRAVLDDGAATAAFGWLGALAYVDPDPHGLEPDDLVRRLVDSDHRWRDPHGYDDLHRTIWQHLARRAVESHGDVAAAAVTDLVHLQRYRFPEQHESGALVDVDGLTAVDAGDDLAPTVLGLAEATLGPDGRKDVEYWLARRPEAFSVYGPGSGAAPVAFLCLLHLGERDDDVATADPVVGAVWDHATRGGALLPDEQLEVARFVVPRPRTGPAATGDPRIGHWYDTIVRRGARLTASYVVLHDPAGCEGFMAGLDHPLEVAVPASEQLTWGVFAHDWRLVPLAQHLDRVLPPVGVSVPDETTRPLDRDVFDDAVRQALRDWHDDAALDANVLATHPPASRSDRPGAAVRTAVEEAIESLADDPRRAKAHRAVATTYLTGVTTQEAAASRLGIPFSTYRRHLGKGTALVCDRLWVAHQGG